MNRFLVILKKIYYLKFLNIRLNVFIYFIGLSFIFWLLNALNKEYSTSVYLKIKYVQIPNTKIVKEEFLLPRDFKLHIKGQGFSLLQNRVSSYFSSIKLNISDLIKKDNNQALAKNSFLFETANLRFFLEKKLLGDVEIMRIEPAKILILFSNVAYKKIAIKANTDISILNQFMQVGELVISPDSINITGPKEVLDTLKFINTKILTLSNLNKPQKKRVDLLPIHNVKYPRNSVLITINVEEILQNEITIPIQVKNKPIDITPTLYPPNIVVKYTTNISAHKNIKNYDFQAIIDYNMLINNKIDETKVTLNQYPTNIQILSIHPEKVKFILEKTIDDNNNWINRGYR